MIFRFRRRSDRDAWVHAAARGEVRESLNAGQVPLRLRTGRHVEGLELRDGPEPPQNGHARSS